MKGWNAEMTYSQMRLLMESDVTLIDEMHQRLSKDSIYYRYLGPCKPTLEDLKHLCGMDPSACFTVVAVVGEINEKVIAMACYRINPENPTTAEPAILVEDSYQGHGLGTDVFSALPTRIPKRCGYIRGVYTSSEPSCAVFDQSMRFALQG